MKPITILLFLNLAVSAFGQLRQETSALKDYTNSTPAPTISLCKPNGKKCTKHTECCSGGCARVCREVFFKHEFKNAKYSTPAPTKGSCKPNGKKCTKHAECCSGGCARVCREVFFKHEFKNAKYSTPAPTKRPNVKTKTNYAEYFLRMR